MFFRNNYEPNRYDDDTTRSLIDGYYSVDPSRGDANTPEKAFHKAKNQLIVALEHRLARVKSLPFDEYNGGRSKAPMTEGYLGFDTAFVDGDGVVHGSRVDGSVEYNWSNVLGSYWSREKDDALYVRA